MKTGLNELLVDGLRRTLPKSSSVARSGAEERVEGPIAAGTAGGQQAGRANGALVEIDAPVGVAGHQPLGGPVLPHRRIGQVGGVGHDLDERLPVGAVAVRAAVRLIQALAASN